MNPSHSTLATRIKVGVFTLLSLLLIGGITVFVNDKPYWWKPCQMVKINVEDATGLKPKSPIRSLGLEIGYLVSVELTETHVTLGICITAPVDVLPTTRAYIRGEGFLGDKFVELKPVRYLGESAAAGTQSDSEREPAKSSEKALEIPAVVEPEKAPGQVELESGGDGIPVKNWVEQSWNWILPSAYAAPAAMAPIAPKAPGREIPVGEGSEDVQALVKRVDDLVRQMTGLTTNLKDAINPEDLRKTMQQLNRTLESASKTLAPEGGLNQTAQRTLAKLEDAIEQLRDQMARVNRGEGSVGMILNDPTYAEEIRQAIRNVNLLLSRVGGVRFVVDLGTELLPDYSRSGRGWFQLNIWPVPDRYYLIGISVDPRGRLTNTTTTTSIGTSSITQSQQFIEDQGILITGMLGKVFLNRFDFSIGALHGDGAVRLRLNLGPHGNADRLQVVNDIYTRIGAGSGVDARTTVIIRPWMSIYVRGGVESWKGVNGKTAYSYGAGVAFDDQDIKLLFAFR
jgi:phospholipid/cholesterol/gamma-HCH transport system substrate-binding protein